MRLAAAALALLLVAGCDSASGVDATQAEVAAAAEAFAHRGPRDYTLQYEFRCECTGGATVTVRGGEVVSAEGPGADRARTVEDLFALAQTVFEDGRTGTVRLSDDEPRIPLQVNLDPELGPTDGNVFLNVTRFRVD
ncbi:MAG TPA: DUF6174 domain-containing protein [Rubricoccaceae bacterium]|jgi:hypothetical protein